MKIHIVALCWIDNGEILIRHYDAASTSLEAAVRDVFEAHLPRETRNERAEEEIAFDDITALQEFLFERGLGFEVKTVNLDK